MKLRFKLMVVGTMVVGLLAPAGSASASVTPLTVHATIYGPALIGDQLYVSCWLEAGYGKALWFDRCGVKRQDSHWYGTTETEMWQATTYYATQHDQVLVVTHSGFRCQHGKKYQAWNNGKSTGFVSVAEDSTHTSWKTFC